MILGSPIYGNNGPNPDVDEKAPSKDRAYLPNIEADIKTAKFIEILAICDHTQLSHSRWLTACKVLEEKEIMLELAAIEKGFKSINELKGIQSCHCIKKAGSSSVNMFLNTGDDIPFKTKVGILESKVNGFSKSSVTFIELEKYFSVYYNDNWYIG
ncbi:hypothetical protein AVEN_131720-1 [Araneus ventricosus]|uniref:Uncharacterized protein n=1 Tax=Araneus ventricosus TaxID=182803 RepID=A0A4Y2SJS5_ARAVE|nr:hypothetical protein AVEN_131720-1 [Araneus ventricosus]